LGGGGPLGRGRRGLVDQSARPGGGRHPAKPKDGRGTPASNRRIEPSMESNHRAEVRVGRLAVRGCGAAAGGAAAASAACRAPVPRVFFLDSAGGGRSEAGAGERVALRATAVRRHGDVDLGDSRRHEDARQCRPRRRGGGRRGSSGPGWRGGGGEGRAVGGAVAHVRGPHLPPGWLALQRCTLAMLPAS
jgi:hypothetical protein